MRINAREAPFGPFVRILALERGLSVSDISRMIGIDRSVLFRALMNPKRSHHRPPSLKLVIGIDQALGIVRPLTGEDRVMLFLKAGYLPPFEYNVVYAKENKVYVSFSIDRPLRQEVNGEPPRLA